MLLIFPARKEALGWRAPTVSNVFLSDPSQVCKIQGTGSNPPYRLHALVAWDAVPEQSWFSLTAKTLRETQAAQENKPDSELAEERRIQAPSNLKGYYPPRRYILDDTSHGMPTEEQLCHWR